RSGPCPARRSHTAPRPRAPRPRTPQRMQGPSVEVAYSLSSVAIVMAVVVVVVIVVTVVVFPMTARLRVFEMLAGLVLVARDAIHARVGARLDVAAAVPAREQLRVGAVAVVDRRLRLRAHRPAGESG